MERGFLKVEKQGRINIYSPRIAGKEYIEIESRSFLERMHKSSLKSFVVALYDGKSLSSEDAANWDFFSVEDRRKRYLRTQIAQICLTLFIIAVIIAGMLLDSRHRDSDSAGLRESFLILE